MSAMSREAETRAHFKGHALVHLDALYGAALRLTRDAPSAEDLVQDAVLKAFQHWHQYEPGTNCKAWLFRILTNTFINGYRRRTKERQILDAERGERLADRFFCRDAARQWADPEVGFAERNLSAPVMEALDALRPEFRVVVELSDLQGFTYREIAEIVGCPIGTVMSRLFRARRTLRLMLERHAQAYGLTAAVA